MTFLEKISYEERLTNGIESLKKNTRDGINNTLRQFSLFCEERGSTLKDAVEDMKITKDKKDVFVALQSFVNWLNKKGISSSSIPIYFSHLRTYLYYCGIPITEQERRKEIKYPKIIEDEKHGLSVDEIKSIMNVANPKKKALYYMMLSSGLRIGEAVQLRKKDIELVGDNFMITVRGQTTKTQKGRVCFMSKEATRAVMSYWKNRPGNRLIFATNENVELATGAEEVRFHDYRVKAGFTEKYDSSNRYLISLHSFRAFFITKVSREDPNLAKRLAGQKGYLDQYDRINTEEKLEVYRKIEPELYIYEQRPQSEEIKELTAKLAEYRKEQEKDKETKKMLDEIARKYPQETQRIEKNMEKMFDEFSKKLMKKAISKNYE